MNRTLFAISDDLLALDALLEELGGDVTEETTAAAIDDWLGTLGAERDQKLDNYAALIREIEARAEARKTEAHRLAELVRIDTNRAAVLKARLKNFFIVHDLKPIETARFKLSLVNNGGVLPLVVDLPADDLPEAFQRVKLEVDNDAIRSALDEGEVLPFARYGERGKSLRIK